MCINTSIDCKILVKFMKDINVKINCPDDALLNISTIPNKYLKLPYIRSFQEEMIALAADKDFNGTDLRVFLTIIGNLGYENILSVTQKQIGEQINVQPAEVARAIKKLVKKGYLQVITKIGRQNIYMLNPTISFKSRAKNLKHLKQAWNEQSIPNTQNKPIDIDTDLQPELENKLDDRVEQLSQQFGVPQSKVRQIILSLVDQALASQNQEDLDLPY